MGDSRRVFKVKHLCSAISILSHRRLLNKTAPRGIVDLVMWFSTYLPFRNLLVRVNGFISEPRLVPGIVVQGSILGPLFFLMYINDAFDAIWNGTTLLVGENFKIVCTFRPESLESTINNMSQDLASLGSWAGWWNSPLKKTSQGKTRYAPNENQTIPVSC